MILFNLLYFVWRGVRWLFLFILTFLVADVVGNVLLFLIGGPKRMNWHTRYFFHGPPD